MKMTRVSTFAITSSAVFIHLIQILNVYIYSNNINQITVYIRGIYIFAIQITFFCGSFPTLNNPRFSNIKSFSFLPHFSTAPHTQQSHQNEKQLCRNVVCYNTDCDVSLLSFFNHLQFNSFGKFLTHSQMILLMTVVSR